MKKQRAQVLVFIGCIAAGGFAKAPFAEADRLFTLKIAPVFSEKCNGCHGDDPEKIKGDYNMLTRAGLLAGGEEFGSKVLTPGHADQSFIIDAIKWADPDWEMPPKENDRLSPEQIADMERWINAGAPWPDEATQKAIRKEESRKRVTADGVLVDTSGGLGDEWTYRRYQPDEVWAFQPVTRPPVPAGSANPIDAFITDKLAAAGFELGPQAAPRMLLRRARYDLTGLPPSPSEMNDFLAAWARNPDQAWADTIDRLLASPQYGERWGQHWLDVARYADTAGLSNDYERSNAWRYRDYVIRSLNNDKPYNRFIMEQLAGDEMADRSVLKRLGDTNTVAATRMSGNYKPYEAEWIVATGFLRMGAWDNAMVKDEEARQLYLDDVVNSVGQTFLATTMRCFKCHDHKFDPLPTKDYYRMYAAFAGTQQGERSVPFLESERRDEFVAEKAHIQRMLSFARAEQKKIMDKQRAAELAWYKERDMEPWPDGQLKNVADEDKPPRHAGLSTVEQGQLKVRNQDVWIWTRRLERFEPMAQSVYNSATIQPGGNRGRKLRLGAHAKPAGKVASTILTGGALEAPGASVQPGVLSALGLAVPGTKGEDPYVLPESLEGRRLALAKWIAHPKNQLTTRAIVNRIWQGHFGQGLARNPNNFGVKGAKPTHPELLDWLAADFVEQGWTMKRLHRLIMLSDTYRSGTSHPQLEALQTSDPDNRLLAYRTPRRLSAEELRDSFLASSGELQAAGGGLPIKPEINMEVALQPRMIQFSLAPAYQPSPTPEVRNRRTIYAYRVRGMADPMLELFNQPNPNDSCEMRDAAAVSPQAFSLLNSDMITDRSIAFADHLRKAHSALSDQIQAAFERTLGRAPKPAEQTRLQAYVTDMQDYYEGVTLEPVTYPTVITRTLVEEFSGEPFEYEEILPAFETYTADLKAADVDTPTRALADLCLLLFNANEFIYVY